MISSKEDTSVSISDLRTDAARLLKGLSKHHIILTQKDRPLGVILDYRDFENIMTTIDELEDALISLMSRGKGPKACRTRAARQA